LGYVLGCGVFSVEVFEGIVWGLVAPNVTCSRPFVDFKIFSGEKT